MANNTTNSTSNKPNISKESARITEPSQLKFEDNYIKLKQCREASPFSQMHQIKRISDDKIFALKEISKSKIYALQDTKRKSLFKKIQSEIDIMSRLKHKNIVKCIETFETKNTLYIIMEQCTGGELFDRINNKGTYKENECKIIIKQICEALFYMHNKQKVVHLNLKPENILFVDNTETSDIKITDFRTSKILKRLHSFKHLCGTPYYTAPEVITGQYQNQCDMWSIGVITYVLIFGFVPFYVDRNKYYGINETKEIYKLILKGFKPIICEGYGPWFPKDLKHLITENCMHFIEHLIETDISKRFTAKDALLHPWLNDFDDLKEEKEDLNINMDLYAMSFNNFCIGHKFKYVVSGIFHEQYKNIRRKHFERLRYLFQQLDLNCNDKISYDEFEKGMLKCKNINVNKLRQIFDQLDMDKNGVIVFENLLDAIVYDHLICSDVRLYDAFKYLVENNSEKISLGILKQQIHKMNIYKDINSILSIMNDVDSNNDGHIDYKAFLIALHPDLNVYEQLCRKNAAKLKPYLEIKTRKDHLKKYFNCFIGQEAVSIIINLGIAKTQKGAINFCNQLISMKIIEHVEIDHKFIKFKANDHNFTNDHCLYRFISDRPDKHANYSLEIDTQHSIYFDENELNELKQKGRELKEHLEIKDRIWLGKKYKQCFIGSECVKIMIKLQYANTEKDVVKIGNKLLDAGIIRHVVNEHRFKNKGYYYNFMIGSVESIVKEGWMEKQGKKMHSWKRRYFKLYEHGTMEYYAKENDSLILKGTLNVKTLIRRTQLKSWNNKKFGVKVYTSQRGWKFACEDNKERNQWKYAIGKVSGQDI